MTSFNLLLTQAQQWQQAGVIRALDLHWIQTLAQHSRETQTGVLLAGILASRALGQGHICLPLADVFGCPFAGAAQFAINPSWEGDGETFPSDQAYWTALLQQLGLHSLAQLKTQLSQSTLVALAENENVADKQPLVLAGERLYLNRYFAFEQRVLAYIQQAQAKPSYEFNAQWLDQLFPSSGINNENKQINKTSTPDAASEIDWQRVAVANAAMQSFAIISGGPGTGKTTTVTKLLALLVMQAQASETSIHIELAAPTGKAAARLTESIINAKQQLAQVNGLSTGMLSAIPEQATTLHRLLGSRYGRSRFVHNKENPLHLDVLLVDEASMVDLPMMAKLLDALPESARLILLGDKDQLASVEAGSTLADLTYGIEQTNYASEWLARLSQYSGIPLVSHSPTGISPTSNSPTSKTPIIRQHLSLLSKSYRFNDQSGIGHLSKAINRGDQKTAMAWLKQAPQDFVSTIVESDIAWCKLENADEGIDIVELAKGYDTYWQCVADCLAGKSSIPALFAAFAQYQILTAVRSGAFGVEQLNQALEASFYQRGRIREQKHWYPGKAVMMTRNDPTLGLFNGDIGICMQDAESDRLRVWFETAAGSASGMASSLQSYLPSRLGESEAVFAMTVHKSQGSEFEQVDLILPPHDSAVLTKELLYTGVTRAKKRFRLWASDDTVKLSLKNKVKRYSGLIEHLWGE